MLFCWHNVNTLPCLFVITHLSNFTHEENSCMFFFLFFYININIHSGSEEVKVRGASQEPPGPWTHRNFREMLENVQYSKYSKASTLFPLYLHLAVWAYVFLFVGSKQKLCSFSCDTEVMWCYDDWRQGVKCLLHTLFTHTYLLCMPPPGGRPGMTVDASTVRTDSRSGSSPLAQSSW